AWAPTGTKMPAPSKATMPTIKERRDSVSRMGMRISARGAVACAGRRRGQNDGLAATAAAVATGERQRAGQGERTLSSEKAPRLGGLHFKDDTIYPESST